ncbi:hypothetical protein N9S04_00270 [bacterium]|nr:hypothetical protein [bacterium]
MPKVKIAESTQDNLKVATGFAKVVDNYGFGTARIKVIDSRLFNLEYGGRKIEEQDGIIAEVQTIKLTSKVSTSVRSLVSQNLTLDVDYTDHYTTFEIPQNALDVETISLNKTAATYDVFSNFNFNSPEYDRISVAVPEAALPPAFQAPEGADLSRLILPGGHQEVNDKPYYNEIAIKNRVTNDFTNFLRKVGLYDTVLNDYLEGEKVEIPFSVQNNQTVSEDTPVPIYSLLDWVNSESFESDLYSEDKIDDSEMINTFKKTLFLSYVRQLSKNFRNFKDIVSNTECYKEDFCYSIDKYLGVPVDPKAQQIYIPAEDDISTFMDSQIKYGETYAYKGTAHYILVGNSYRYTNLRFVEDEALVDVVNKPTVMIVPFEMFTQTIKVIQPPSLPPDVRFVTRMNSENKINIYLSPTKGRMMSEFITVLPEDERQLEEMTINRREGQQLFEFSTNREDGLYEIFKTKTPPASYRDFIDKKLVEIGAPFKTEDAMFTDRVAPNTKYYYMFRKINEKDLVSNPSPVYEVELLVDADDAKVMVGKYDFPQPDVYQMSKKFKSLFQVTPVIEQTLFDEEQNVLFNKDTYKGTVDRLKLGIAQESVWGRRFKIRVKSTTTGKIIDYNVNFKLKKNKSEEEF